MDCPQSGSGWTGNLNAEMGPFKEVILCNCTITGTCGSGFCQKNNLCYHNVQCMNGGWNGTLTKCTGTCSSTGCA